MNTTNDEPLEAENRDDTASPGAEGCMPKKRTFEEISLEIYGKTMREMTVKEAGAALREIMDGKRPEFREASDLIDPVTITPEPGTGFIWIR